MCLKRKTLRGERNQRKGFSHYHLLGAALDPYVKLMGLTNASKEGSLEVYIKRSSLVLSKLLSTLKMFLRIPVPEVDLLHRTPPHLLLNEGQLLSLIP